MSNGASSPFWSVMIPTCDRVDFLRKALRSVLDQDSGPAEMQIEVVDNGAGDSPVEQVVAEAGGGRVGFYRQPKHVGMSENWNTCIHRARGRWVHILHDDDMVLPGFYDAYRTFIADHPDVVMLFSRAVVVDERDEWLELDAPPASQDASGVIADAFGPLLARNFIKSPGVVARRAELEKVGGFRRDVFYAADWELWLRLAARGPVGYVHRPYLLYREHTQSDTSRLILTAENIVGRLEALEVALEPGGDAARRQWRRIGRRGIGREAAGWRVRLHDEGRYRPALRHAWWAMKLDPSCRNLARLVKSALVVVGTAATRS